MRAFPTTIAERVELIKQGFVVETALGTDLLYLDLSREDDRRQGEALIAMRRAAQDDKDRVGDPR